MTTVLVTEFIDGSALAFLENRVRVQYVPGIFEQADVLAEVVKDADALIIRNRTQVTNTLLSYAPRLRAIGRLGVGLDNIDLEAAKRRNIAVLPATGANAIAVAEYVMSALMHLYRPMTTGLKAMMGGRWPREQSIGGEIAGRTLGLVGYGQIAQSVAARAASFGMRVVYFDPYLGTVSDGGLGQPMRDLDALLETADCVSLHVPLTAETHHLMNRERLAQMKTGAVLINTARGGIVDEKALVHQIRIGQLGGAALDVFEREPLDPLNGALFEGIERLILTPHIAGVTHESNRRVSQVTVENVLRILADDNSLSTP